MHYPCVAVCGNINVDICAASFSPLIAADSNPGTVRLSLGGVGRNIAHNLCLLGQRVTMITALAGDVYGQQAEKNCAHLGIDLSHALRVPEGRTGSYVFINGPDGDLALAVCDAALIEQLTPEVLAQRLPVLNEAAAVVVDANLSAEAIAFLAEHCTAPLFADPVSVTKAEKLRPVLGRLHTLKPNRLEAELLSGRRITDAASLRAAAEALLRTGLRRVFISLGSKGAFCAEAGHSLMLPCPETAAVNTAGGGDAMMAGLVRAWCDGLSLEQTGRFALACGAIAVESAATINPELTLAGALSRAGL